MTPLFTLSKWTVLLLAVTLGACAIQPTQTPTEEITEDTLLESTTAPSATGIPAADAMLSQGEALRLSGNYAGAANQFERGIRLAPRSASLYLALAKTRLAMDDYRNAQQMAQRAVSLLPSQPKGSDQRNKAEAWLVIAQAKEALGDRSGADQARANAEAVW